MHRAAQQLLGERDFSSFRAAGCQSRTPFRRMDRVNVHRCASLVVLDIQANAFLLHMVRNIAGALWEIGLGRRQADWLADVLEARDRTLCSPTAPAQGLYLTDVSYPGQDFPRPALPGLLRALGGLDRFA
jgi:tRNA pseudouridine38-40 synthase